MQRTHAASSPERMRLRHMTVDRPVASFRCRIFEKPRFLLRGRGVAGTEMTIAVSAYNFKHALRVLGIRGLKHQARCRLRLPVLSRP